MTECGKLNIYIYIYKNKIKSQKPWRLDRTLPDFQSGLWNLVESSLRGRRSEVTGPHTSVNFEQKRKE